MDLITFKYPNLYKKIKSLFFMVGVIIAIMGVILPVLQITNMTSPTIDDWTAIPAGILGGVWFLLITVYVNMYAPDIQVRMGQFRLKTPFVTV